MSSIKSECRKFSANIFNKTKCQNCFRTKEAHSAEALESNRATRKVSKCGYLFVAPDWDFTVSINRTKRWQRRWFVLYDDGELTYSVDEHPDTVPQAVIDMNKVLEVSDAEDITGNQYAIAITAPEKVHFVKGTSREESRWWFDVLNMLPRNNVRGKHKRNATFPGIKATTTPTAIIQDHDNNVVEQNPCADSVQRPRFLSTSETCRGNVKDFTWLQVNGNDDEDVFPTKDYDTADPTGEVNHNSSSSNEDEDDDEVDDDVDEIENDLEATSPSEVELNNALNNLITSAVQLGQRSPFQYKQEETPDSESPVLEKDVEPNEKKVPNDPSESSAVKTSRNRRYQKRENRNHRSQRSRSDGVAKMIPSREYLQQADADLLSNNTSSKNKGDEVVALLSDTSSTTKNIPGHRLEVLNGKASPVPSRRRHRSDTAEHNMPPKRVIENKRDTPSGKCTLKKSESLMNIASELSPELRSKISELKRNYSYKGSPSMYRNKQESSSASSSQGNGPSAIRSANNPFIRPVRDTDPNQRTSMRSSQEHGDMKRPSSVSSHSSSTSSWDVGVNLNNEDSLTKKGWLMRQTLTKDWSRHWFVLKNASLTYYRDPSAEDCGILDGVLDLNQVTNINELEPDGAFPFCLIMWDNKKHILASASPEIRSSWIKAIQCASNLWDSESRKDFSHNEIVLPDHIFHTGSNNSNNNNGTRAHEKVQQQLSVSSSPCLTPDLEKMVDLSSSDDQSEYFSIIDEEEAADRSASPRTLPPSPPVNRNAMSLVKERSRTRCGSISSSVKENASPDAVDGEQQNGAKNTLTKESAKNVDKTCQDVNLQIQSNPKSDSSRATPVSTKQEKVVEVNGHAKSPLKCGNSASSATLHITAETNGINSVNGKQLQNQEEMNPKKSQQQGQLNKSDIPAKQNVIGNSSNDSNKLKYELLKTKYLKNDVEWEKKMRKERQLSSKEGFDGTLKVLQKTRHLLTDLKVKLCDNVEYQKSVEAVQNLCEELEKLSRTYEKKLKRDNEVKKLRRSLSEVQIVCCNKQMQIEEEQAKYSSLSAVIQKKDERISNLQQEVERLKNACLKKSSASGSQSEQEAIACCNCAALSSKLSSVQMQLRKLKKELNDSHKSFDDLDITCFKLKQDLIAQEKLHQSQLALMTARVDDLTSKYTISEKNLRQLRLKMSKMESRQERRRSSLKNKESLSLSKECEAKLFELEQKISNIEYELREDQQRSSLREEISLPSPDVQSEASENADCEASLRKRLSQDSTSGSENTGVFLRLHSLGTRVKNASEAVERHAQESSTELCSLDKPKICLQLRNEEESIAPDEDWSTLSYTTSLTDLQTIDCLENDLPTNWSDYYECMDQKLESLFSWLKMTVSALQRQENSHMSEGFASLNAAASKDIAMIYSSVSDVLENIPDIKYEDTLVAGMPSDAIKLHYKSALVNETARALHKLLSSESGNILEKFTVCEKALGFIWNHFQLLESSENQMDANITCCMELLEKMLSVCITPHESFLNNVDVEQVSHQPPNRISVLEKYCLELMKVLDRSKESLFSALYQVLADVPVQDDDAVEQLLRAPNENFDEIHPLLENIIVTLKEFYELAVQDLFGNQNQRVTVLQCEETAFRSWSAVACEVLKTEAESVIDDLKKVCPQVREQNESLFGFSDALYRKVVYASVDFARIAMIRALTQSIVNFLSEEGHADDEVESKEWAVSVHNSLCDKAVSLAKGESSACNHRQVAELLIFDYALRAGAREMKMSEQLEAIHHLHQKELEAMHSETESLQQENGKLKSYYEICEGTGSKLQELQSKLEKLSKEQTCDQCESLCIQLQTLREQNEADLFALRKQHKDKTEELHKHLQLVLEQKDEIHIREVQKLEEQLQVAQRKLNHLEVEYSEQIQSLRELYEKKTSLKQDPINEESIRRRYQTEIEQLKGLCEKGLTAMENSYRRITTELERRHKQELSVLEAEKEKALKEETQATLTALEVLRRAHAEELQREIAQFKEEFKKKMQAGYQSEVLHQQHESEIEEIKREIISVSDKYSVRCLEIASLEERVEALEHELQEANHQLFDLTARNKQLKVHLGLDIAQKKELLEECSDPESLESSKLLLDLKEGELVEQTEINAQLKQELHLAQMRMKKQLSRASECIAEVPDQSTAQEDSCIGARVSTSQVIG